MNAYRSPCVFVLFPVVMVIIVGLFIELRILILSCCRATTAPFKDMLHRRHDKPTIRTFKAFVMWYNVCVLSVCAIMENRDGKDCPFDRKYWYDDTIQRNLTMLFIAMSIYLFLTYQKNKHKDKTEKYKAAKLVIWYLSQWICLKIVYASERVNHTTNLYLYFFIACFTPMVLIRTILKVVYLKKMEDKKISEGFVIKRLIILIDLLKLLLILFTSERIIYLNVRP